MPYDQFTAEESRKLAVLIARSWSDPKLASAYKSSPEAVLSGAGINLAGRAVPDIPEKPAELAAQALVSSGQFAGTSSASSVSTITCPCSGCTASCAGCHSEVLTDFRPDSAALLKLTEDPEARAHARKLTAAWGLSINIKS